MISPNDHVLFFGDSITDAGRNRAAAPGESDGWGNGYVYQLAARLGSDLADYELCFSNQGIGGNRITDLEGRLQSDVLTHQPNLVSILVGINDVWRRYDSGQVSEIEPFAASYRRILEKLSTSQIEIVILEPFLLPVPADRRAWREDLNPKIDVIRDLAREFGATYVPLDGIFAAASMRREAQFWLPDGVHPSPAGHALIAESWLSAVIG
ncbi:Lysophospholipase L1 [Abditibacterium utsteinense]|uniref:Lysophospholipase L1 n=1 Tax=Abditibacterium utsteinense TaxID=1960156 RepID=A0A2S8STI1_9BACT|nr:SGNH/GDSL hydrolase family protein [Abditibacterium utsteinense]PQV64111.1 Lysophospholipase L1 [Abditibacterium utsteinense]